MDSERCSDPDTPIQRSRSQVWTQKTSLLHVCFINAIRYVAARILIGSTDASLIKPSKSTKDPLKGLSLNGRFPALTVNISLSSQQVQNLASELIRFSRNFSKTRIAES